MLLVLLDMSLDKLDLPLMLDSLRKDLDLLSSLRYLDTELNTHIDLDLGLPV